MSRVESRKRIAVIVPQNRLWNWHQKVISALEQWYDVDVYSNTLAPRYPLLLRIWMHVERRLLGDFPLAKFTAISTMPWQQVDRIAYLFILNLSEASIDDSIYPILEPRFGDHADSLGLVAALLNCKNPFLSIRLAGQKETVVTSYVAIPDKIVLLRGLQVSFARLMALTVRAARHLTVGSRAAMLPKVSGIFAPYSTLLLSLFVARFSLDKLFNRLLRKFRYQETWSIALLCADQSSIPHGVPLRDFKVLPDDGRRFYADPFLFTDNDQKWLFVEEFNYQAGKGIISCAKVTELGICESPRPVLEQPYHLSYPFVFGHAGEIYMIPETANNRTVELYRASSFPAKWELYRVLLEDILLYDATLLQHKGRWWLFAAVAHEAGSSQDELAIFHSEFLEGPWQHHPLNPVKSDCRSARPAGHIVFDGDRLLRPAQDCEHGYGDAVVWLQVDELTLQHFSERKIARWSGSDALHGDGLHTFNCDGKLAAIDIRRAIWRWPFANRE